MNVNLTHRPVKKQEKENMSRNAVEKEIRGSEEKRVHNENIVFSGIHSYLEAKTPLFSSKLR
jgi:hypothetical protein